MTAKQNQTLTAVPNDATKAQEIEWVETAARLASCNNGTYLADLFSAPMVQWVSEQIQNDFPPDLYGHYTQMQFFSAETASKLRAEVERLSTELANLQSRTDEEMRRVRADAAAERTADAETRRRSMEREMEKTERLDKLERENDELSAQLHDAAEEIKRLKLMVFDIEHPAPARAG